MTTTTMRFDIHQGSINRITNGSKLNNAIGHEGVSPIVRVPWSEEWMIKRALDAGAHGIMTPMCHSAVCSRAPIGLLTVR